MKRQTNIVKRKNVRHGPRKAKIENEDKNFAKIDDNIYDNEFVEKAGRMIGYKKAKNKPLILNQLLNDGKLLTVEDKSNMPLLINWKKGTYFLLAPLEGEDEDEDDD